MHWLDYQIKLPLPPARMRWPVLMGIAVVSGLIPHTESDLTTALTCCVFPMLIGIWSVGYWRSSPLRTLFLVTYLITVVAFTLRTLLAPLHGSILSLSTFLTVDWSVRVAFLVPLGAQLFMVSLVLLPLHFVFRQRHATAT